MASTPSFSWPHASSSFILDPALLSTVRVWLTFSPQIFQSKNDGFFAENHKVGRLVKGPKNKPTM